MFTDAHSQWDKDYMESAFKYRRQIKLLGKYGKYDNSLYKKKFTHCYSVHSTLSNKQEQTNETFHVYKIVCKLAAAI